MKIKGLKSALLLSCGLLALTGSANAGPLIYHGGPVIVSAKVVDIFWGPSFANPASPDYIYAQTLKTFRNQFGTSPEYNILTQYYQIVGGVRQYVQLSNLGSGTADWFDTSTPPTNVTDAAVQSEIRRYLAGHAFDSSTIYEVFLPAASYSSNGSLTSCGGPSLAYCTYHNFFNISTVTGIKYTVQPYASCGGCQIAGWTPAQNQEDFVAQSTRSSVIDPLFTGWYDATGVEGQDKCAWSPPPFLDGGYGYPYDWSNAANACVKKK
jgi:hypothetical protein